MLGGKHQGNARTRWRARI